MPKATHFYADYGKRVLIRINTSLQLRNLNYERRFDIPEEATSFQTKKCQNCETNFYLGICTPYRNIIEKDFCDP